MTKVAVLADTHIPRRAKTLTEKAWECVRNADIIIHAGDVLTAEFLEELSSCAPLYAVRGNNDLNLGALPETLEITIDGVNLGIIHDSGSKDGRGKRMRRRFGKADVVIFGHSHIPINEMSDDLLLFNPGSPTDKRMQPHRTMGILTLAHGKAGAEIIIVD